MIAAALAAPLAAAAPVAATAGLVLAGTGETVANGSLLLAVPLAFDGDRLVSITYTEPAADLVARSRGGVGA